ncbi:MAG: hypothetical protein NMK33_02420 [Candidatus Cardinium sp.]|nr:MAG: hypothetical protein NMK33_02420 [Candidatus Cardinium sp.]
MKYIKHIFLRTTFMPYKKIADATSMLDHAIWMAICIAIAAAHKPPVG